MSVPFYLLCEPYAAIDFFKYARVQLRAPTHPTSQHDSPNLDLPGPQIVELDALQRDFLYSRLCS